MGHALRIASDSCLISGICFSVSVSPFLFLLDSSGTTLMDLITSVPTPIPSSAPPPPSPSSASPAALPPPNSGIGKLVTTDPKSKRGTLLQIQSDTISAAKAALNPVRINILPQKQKQKKKLVGVMTNK